jgi:hypothetical protein
MIESPHFGIKELVCQHVYNKYKNFAWNFFDFRLIVTINTLRDRINKAIYVNSWDSGGKFDERGLRCPQCEIVKSKTDLYMSAHCLGKGVDLEVEGLIAQEVRDWIILHKNWWPYPIRLEDEVDWIHVDTYNNEDDKKVILFKA